MADIHDNKWLAVIGGKKSSVLLAEDNFTGADGTGLAAHPPDKGPAWSVIAGAYTLSGNKANPSGGSNVNLAVQNLTTPDVHLYGDFVFPASQSFIGGFALRVQDNANYWDIRQQNNTLFIYERVAGGWTLRASVSTGADPALNSTMNLEVIASGNEITAYAKNRTYSISYSSGTFNNVNSHGLFGDDNNFEMMTDYYKAMGA